MKKLEFQPQRPFLLTEAPPAIRTICCLGTISLYLMVKFILYRYLPPKWFTDSNRMYNIVETDTGLDNSFVMTGRIFSLFPTWSHDILVAMIGVAIIVISYKVIKSWRGLIFIPLILVPLLLLGLIAPSKETIVFFMTLLALGACRYVNNVFLFIAFIAGLYLTYGMFVRIYYLLILGVWAALLIAPKLPKAVLLLLMMSGTVVFFILPGEIFYMLQEPRDSAYRAAEYFLMSDNRTNFSNPFYPDNPFAFLGNYLYAFIILHFPFILFISPREVLLFVNVLIYGWLMYRGIRSDDSKTYSLAVLFLSHVLVLWLFEPDFGSYFRHFSSVFLYLVPALALAENNEKNTIDVKESESKVPENFVKKSGAGRIMRANTPRREG